jgi:hypothetical protein
MVRCTIATLTCNDRASLFPTIDRVIENTDLSGFAWTIFAQGCTTAFLQRIRDRFAHTDIPLHLIEYPENLGCSKGFNSLWKAIADDFDFGLMLEDDWYLVPPVNRNWLQVSLHLMTCARPDVDIVYLRKYTTDPEKYQYGWTRHIPYVCFQGRLRFNYAEGMKKTQPFQYQGHRFQQIPEFMYTNNPCLFRISAYKKVGVFPVQEYNDRHETMGKWLDSSGIANHWGWAEALAMEKTAELTVMYLEEGLFSHNACL